MEYRFSLDHNGGSQVYKYKIITFPFSGNVNGLSKDGAIQFFNWYLQQIPIRITQLSEFIIKTPGYDKWIPDNSSDSLIPLGQWFSQKISTRDRTPFEIHEINSKLGKFQGLIPIARLVLSQESYSLAFDLGMYLSQVLIKNVPGLHWELVTKPKNDAFYNHPVLKLTGKMMCDPVHLSIIYAGGLNDGTYKPIGLKELYEIWKKDFVENPY